MIRPGTLCVVSHPTFLIEGDITLLPDLRHAIAPHFGLRTVHVDAGSVVLALGIQLDRYVEVTAPGGGRAWIDSYFLDPLHGDDE